MTEVLEGKGQNFLFQGRLRERGLCQRWKSHSDQQDKAREVAVGFRNRERVMTWSLMHGV